MLPRQTALLYHRSHRCLTALSTPMLSYNYSKGYCIGFLGYTGTPGTPANLNSLPLVTSNWHDAIIHLTLCLYKHADSLERNFARCVLNVTKTKCMWPGCLGKRSCVPCLEQNTDEGLWVADKVSFFNCIHQIRVGKLVSSVSGSASEFCRYFLKITRANLCSQPWI